MKTISTALAAHLAGEVTRLAMCWHIKRTDGVEMGFTNHDRDLVVDGLTYFAASGFTPSAIANSDSLNVDNLEIEGMLSSGHIQEPDVMAGRYDFAELTVFYVNHADISQGKLRLKRGWLGEVRLQGGRFVTEVRGLTQRLSQTIGQLYSPSCRAMFGDAQCKVSLASHTFTGTVSATTNAQHFTDSAMSQPSGVFDGGTVSFSSGDNAGLKMEVKEYVFTSGIGGVFTLALPMPFSIAAGNGYTAVQGCDKTFSTCKTRYGNAINFHGEPHVPGIDRILETAGTRSTW